jgi:hypothetical protein
MEDILDVYARPPDPARPLVCFDEAGKELRADLRPTLPAAPGRLAREDATYVRHGSANLFCACAPHLGWRHVTVSEQRTGIEWAEALRELVDMHFPDAERIVLVLDNLSTHRPAALYRAFPPAEAKRILDKLELHYTPVHGSWLNLAEVELSALARQCLRRRIPDQPTLEREVAAWTAARNADEVRLHWRLTSSEARVRLTHLYPIPAHDT